MSEETRREAVERCLERLESGFRRRWENNPDFRDGLQGKDRDILIDLDETGSWWLEVRDGDLVAVHEGHREDPDVRIGADAEDFVAVFDGELSPLRAYATGRMSVDAGLRDIMLVKSFL